MIIQAIVKFIEKLSSGRYVLTVLVGFGFVYGFMKSLISTDAFIPVALTVIYSYFNREDRNGSSGSNSNIKNT